MYNHISGAIRRLEEAAWRASEGLDSKEALVLARAEVEKALEATDCEARRSVMLGR